MHPHPQTGGGNAVNTDVRGSGQGIVGLPPSYIAVGSMPNAQSSTFGLERRNTAHVPSYSESTSTAPPAGLVVGMPHAAMPLPIPGQMPGFSPMHAPASAWQHPESSAGMGSSSMSMTAGGDSHGFQLGASTQSLPLPAPSNTEFGGGRPSVGAAYPMPQHQQQLHMM